MSTLATTNLKHASSGSNNVVLASDGTTTITAPSNIIKSGTAVASTSGVSIEFTGLPSWVKRITLMFNGVSTSGTSNMVVQIGSGSYLGSGYTSNSASGATVVTSTSGYITTVTLGAASTFYGHAVFTLVSGTLWVASHTVGGNSGNVTANGGGVVSLSGALDRIRLTPLNGTDTFDQGSVNIFYEG